MNPLFPQLAPLYIPLDRPDVWDRELAKIPTGNYLHPEHSSAVILNPDSGPGFFPDPAWQARRAQLRERGILAYGYVPILRGEARGPEDRPGIDAVTAPWAIERWAEFYEPDGIFLDEFPTDGRWPNVQALVLLARRMCSPRLDSMERWRCIVNPGAVPSELIVEAMPQIHAWCTHEDRDQQPGVDDITPPPAYARLTHPTPRQAWIGYNDPNPEASIARAHELGWHYAWSTSDPAPRGNPYDANDQT